MLEGRFICVESEDYDFMKVGKIYEFEKGKAIREDGSFTQFYKSLENFHLENKNFATIKPLTPKQLLKSGDKVTYRDGNKRWVLVETGSLHMENGKKVHNIEDYDDNLLEKNKFYSQFNIMKIERGTELIWEREEKSAKQIEIESIENEMKKLAEKSEQVRKEL